MISCFLFFFVHWIKWMNEMTTIVGLLLIPLFPITQTLCFGLWLKHVLLQMAKNNISWIYTESDYERKRTEIKKNQVRIQHAIPIHTFSLFVMSKVYAHKSNGKFFFEKSKYINRMCICSMQQIICFFGNLWLFFKHDLAKWDCWIIPSRPFDWLMVRILVSNENC